MSRAESTQQSREPGSPQVEGKTGAAAGPPGDPGTRPSLRVRGLTIERFLGIASKEDMLRFTAGDLSPSLTIVSGPNASGKTTTARAIQRVLWPEAGGEPALLHAELVIEDQVWSVDVDGTSHRWSQAGETAQSPVICPVEERDRYTLSLHDLLTAEDHALAAHIRRELSGGYSLSEARNDLSFTESPSTPRGDLNGLKTVRERIREARRYQARLQEREQALVDLRQQADQAAHAVRESEAVAALLAWREAVRAAIQARQRLRQYDPRIANLRGGELDKLRQWREKIKLAQRDIARREKTLGDCKAALEDTSRNGNLPDATHLQTCRDLVQDLKRYETARDDDWKTLGGARRKQQEARNRIGEQITQEQLEALDHLQPSMPLEDAVRAAESVGAAQGLLERFEGVAFRDEDPTSGPSVDDLRRGIDALHAWLGEPAVSAEDEPIAWGWPFVFASASCLLALLLAWLVHVVMLLAAGAFGVLAWALRPRTGDHATPSRRPEWEATFKRLDLDEPVPWDPDGVRKRIDELDEAWRAHSVKHKLAERDDLLCKDLRQKVEAERKHCLELRERIRRDLGTDIEEIDDDPLAVFHLVTRIIAWQDASDAAAEAEEEYRTAESQVNKILGALREALAPFTEEEIKDGTSAEGAVRRLSQRVDECARLRQKQQDLEGELHARQVDLQNLHERCEELLRSMQLTGVTLDDAESVLVEWMAQSHAFAEAEEIYRQCRAAAQNQRNAVRRYGKELLEPLQRLRIPQLRRRQDELEGQVARRQDVIKEVAEIETLVREAKQKHKLESLLAQRDRIVNGLKARREEGFGAIAGDLLCSMVSDRLESQASGVLRRAQALTTDITHGRYRLLVKDVNGEAELRARDNTTGTIHSLDTVSSGTRVQLLVAARLAFLEASEGQGPRLPLVLDEILGNSDDERADALIDAVITAAISGRQVITFTAQEDEVGKWRRQLDQVNVPYTVLELPQVHPVTLPRVPSEPDAQPKVPPPPVPYDAVAYAETLGVPAMVPGQTTIDGLHLWYVVDDAAALHALLTAGYSRWGQLEQLLAHGGDEAVRALFPEESELSMDRLRARAALFGQLVSLLRIGRGRLVDRLALEASGAVSERFIDEVAELASNVEGRAEKIVTSLDEGEVRGFRTKNTEALREWLLDHDHLDPREPLGVEELRVRLHAGVNTYIGSGALTIEDVERALRMAQAIT